MTSSAVTSLAILKVNWERLGRDYLDNLIPFVISAVCNGPKGAVSLPKIQSTVQESFGLLLPLNPLKIVLSRLAKTGHIRRESGVYFTQPHECGDQDFAELRQSTATQISTLITKLVAFAKERIDATWSSSQAEAARFHLTEERADSGERVVPPVLEQAGCLRGDVPSGRVGQAPPAVHLDSQLVDQRPDIVLLGLS
jgi:hypothetical protein